MLSKLQLRLPSPALVLAAIALFVALGGTAVAASVVPLAKRALQADNAKKLGGRTPAQLAVRIAAMPGPTASVASLTGTKSAGFSLNPQEAKDVIVPCDSGQRAVGGGFDSNGPVISLDTRPTSDGAGWAVFVQNLHTSQGASGNVYAVCLR
jgi:hypothetical protein